MLTYSAWALFGKYWFVQVVEKSLSANGSDTKYRAFLMSKCKQVKSNYMKEFILILGTKDAGKTTTAWVVYQRLLPYSSSSTLCIKGTPVVNRGEIIYKPSPANQPENFKAILDLPGYKAAIISGGDDPALLKKEIDSVYDEVDFIVISLRSIKRPGSSQKMIATYYPKDYTRPFWTKYNPSVAHPMDIINSKRPLGDQIANYILVQTTQRPLL